MPQESLDSFAWEFRQGMAARAKALGDTGESSPEHWETPLGTPDVHVVLVARRAGRGAARGGARARPAGVSRALPGIAAIWRQDCHALPTETEPFGFRDGISHPAIEGSGIPGTNPHEPPLKAGEFVLGYPDEMGGIQPMPSPRSWAATAPTSSSASCTSASRRSAGTCRTNATSPEDEELLAAKMMGRWRSGAPLALCPVHDDPALGADPQRNNDFLYQAGRPDRLQDARRLAHPADEPARRGRRRRGPAAPDDPARHRLRPAAARRACWRTTASTAG